MSKSSNVKTKSGFIAILGRPNVGKSTLLNKLLNQKISITSAKPQTTRHRILGIKTADNTQAVFIDTPGLHQLTKNAMNRHMNRAASTAIHDSDIILFMIEALRFNEEDQWVLKKLKKAKCPVILVINKVDKVKDKAKLLPFIESVSQQFQFADIVPIAAEKGINLDKLEEVITQLLPANPFYFDEDQVTDKSERFLAAEIIREKLMRLLGQEVPYALTIEIEQFAEKNNILHLSALIWVEKQGQKAIVIGENGEKLKQVGRQARLELEKIFEQKIFLKLWVKVKENWSDDEKILRSLGYEEK